MIWVPSALSRCARPPRGEVNVPSEDVSVVRGHPAVVLSHACLPLPSQLFVIARPSAPAWLSNVM